MNTSIVAIEKLTKEVAVARSKRRPKPQAGKNKFFIDSHEEVVAISKGMKKFIHDLETIAEEDREILDRLAKMFALIESVKDPKERFVAFLVYLERVAQEVHETTIDELKEAGVDFDDGGSDDSDASSGGNGQDKPN